jgi:hypothetical protein
MSREKLTGVSSSALEAGPRAIRMAELRRIPERKRRAGARVGRVIVSVLRSRKDRSLASGAVVEAEVAGRSARDLAGGR